MQTPTRFLQILSGFTEKRRIFVFNEQFAIVIGMLTLGICSYNKQPPITLDGTVSKMAFEDEA